MDGGLFRVPPAWARKAVAWIALRALLLFAPVDTVNELLAATG
jgi:hypothetical protein